PFVVLKVAQILVALFAVIRGHALAKLESVVWVGHSCPTPLKLLLPVWARPSVQQSGNLHQRNVQPSQTSHFRFIYNSKAKSLGRDCPSHTNHTCPYASLSPGCTTIAACCLTIRK